MLTRTPMAIMAILALHAACTEPAGPAAMAPAPAAASTLPAGKPKMATSQSTPVERLGTAPEGLGLALGAMLPDVGVKDIEGKPMRVADSAKGGALLVVFYRGGWCPFCNAQVKQMADAFPEFQRRGVTPVLVSVDKAEEGVKTRALYEVTFPLLSDPELVAHEAFRVVHSASDEEVKRLKGFGVDIEASSGQQHHKFAVPSMFLFDTGGKLVWRHVDLDYKTRPAVEQILGVLDVTLVAGQ